MKWKQFLNTGFVTIGCLALFTGCSNSTTTMPADLYYTETDMSSISVPSNVRVVGLGEASHGVKQYHEMKAEVFKNMVQNNGCHTFIIEGDFGGALKVDEYIHGGDGTAEEAVGEIGFAIYRTQEMVDLVNWMRSYNENVPEKEALHFYGMDTQRFDNNKEYLFSILDQAAPELSERYKITFSELTDANRTSLETDMLNKGKEAAMELLKELDTVEADIVDISGQPAFDYARECLYTIYACCDIQSCDDYNTTRDQYMFEKVEWFLKHGDGSVLFINGHNGHIGKTSVAGYTCLGELLTENLGNGYYSIGTDAQKTQFNSQKENGEFKVVEVSNVNDLNGQFEHSDNNQYFIDFASAAADETWGQILNSEQTITTLNVTLSGMQKRMRSAYTTTIIPEKTFDGMIIFSRVSPTSIIE